MRYLTAFAVMSTLLSVPLVAAAEEARESSIGQQVGDFALQDFRGKWHHLDDYADSKAIVVAFVGCECPLARLYAPRLQELSEEFADRGVTFLAVNSNRHDSITELANYARVHNLQVPLLKDTGNVVADQFGAERTPEVFLLDADRVIRYRGRIDDQYGLGASSGYAQTSVRRRHLAEAIEELLAGKSVSVPSTEAPGCLIGRVREANEDADVTYSNQIARVLQNHCVECHRPGQIAPFSLTDYDDVVGWAEMIEEVVREQRMPPWHADPRYGHFVNDRSMSEEERELIYEWVRNGAPEGDPSQLPEPIDYPEGWQIEPDQIVYMNEDGFTVPAEGAIDYQYFTVDPGWTEDRWIKATECMPGNRSVVHHIFVFAVPPEVEIPDLSGPNSDRGFNPGAGGVELIAGNAPGTPPMVAPDGMGTFVKAGTRLVFQMHYTPNGSEVHDRSAVGFVFCDASEVKHKLTMNMAINFSFAIPPHADNHPVEATKTFKEDTLIVTLAPHMHLRGKSFRYDLHYPDGTVETILDVPRYDFNWQVIYMFAEPKLAPAGTRMYCLAHFDNSENNLANPNPNEEVRWGDQTWEEMMIGWFSETTDVDTTSYDLPKSRTERFLEEVANGPPRISGLLKRVASSALESDEALERYRSHVKRVVPQVDRVCVSTVEEGRVRFLAVAQPPVLHYPLGQSEREYAADRSALARYAAGSETVVHQDATTVEGEDFAAMRDAIGSSVHVPVEIDGRRMTVSFWCKEKNAFPAPAVEFLQDAAGLLK